MQEKYRVFTSEELVDMYQATQDEAALQELMVRNNGLIYMWIYEARIKHYVNENRALINEEVTAAKREEIRGSLADLVEYMEGK